MKTRSALMKESMVAKSLILFALLPHFLLINRNIDPLHDGIFFSYGLAVADGLAMHRDIPSPYGPVVPWIISATIETFGKFVLIPRIIGFITLVAITAFFYSMMKKYMGKIKSSLVVSLWLLVNSGISEVTSVRWPYGGGIWPTSFAIFAHVLLLYTLIKQLTPQGDFNVRRNNALLFFSGFMVAIAAFSRLQGAATFLVSVTLISYLYVSRRIEKRVFFAISSGAILGVSLPTLILLYQGSFFFFLNQNFIGAFTFAESYLGGSVITLGWLKGLFMSSIFGVAAAIGILAFLFPLSYLSAGFRSLTIYLISITLAILVLHFRSYSLPEDLNRAIDLYSIKILQSFANSFIWPLGLIFFAVLTFIAFRVLRNQLWRESKLSKLSPASLTALTLGLASIPHLYFNFGYIWIITPITLPAAFILYKEFLPVERFSMRLSKAVLGYVNVGIVIYALVFLSGISAATATSSHPFLHGTVRDIDYNKNLDAALDLAQESLIDKRSIFVGCDNFYLIEALNTYSYKLKGDLFTQSNTQSSSLAQLIDGNPSIKVTLVCDPKNHELTLNELFRLDWNLHKRVNLDGIPQFTILQR